MICTFAAFKGVHIVQKTKQLQAALISVLTSIQERAQQTIYALSQHTAPVLVEKNIRSTHEHNFPTLW
jgi:hypothetical protein